MPIGMYVHTCILCSFIYSQCKFMFTWYKPCLFPWEASHLYYMCKNLLFCDQKSKQFTRFKMYVLLHGFICYFLTWKILFSTKFSFKWYMAWVCLLKSENWEGGRGGRRHCWVKKGVVGILSLGCNQLFCWFLSKYSLTTTFKLVARVIWGKR